FRRNALAEELHCTFGPHDPDKLAEVSPRVRVAGRMMAKRVMGKASFIKLQDRTGQIQVFLERDRLPEGVYQDFRKWDIGDIVGAEGLLFKTKTGELTVKAETLRLLTKSLRPLPEKWHGLADMETRYRQRNVALSMTARSRDFIRSPARILAYIRAFLESPDFLEVEDPMLQPLAGGAVARPFTIRHNAPGV